ncbi:MAG: ATP-binding protein, partial [Cyclobacteriaceae bacterium]
EAKGSGLGLFIVKETVEKLGGSISVSSEYGKGTIFSITLPNMIDQADQQVVGAAATLTSPANS